MRDRIADQHDSRRHSPLEFKLGVMPCVPESISSFGTGIRAVLISVMELNARRGMSPINLASVGSMASAMIRLTDRIRTQRFAVLRKPGS